jgi:hypothetical protein
MCTGLRHCYHQLREATAELLGAQQQLRNLDTCYEPREAWDGALARVDDATGTVERLLGVRRLRGTP